MRPNLPNNRAFKNKLNPKFKHSTNHYAVGAQDQSGVDQAIWIWS